MNNQKGVSKKIVLVIIALVIIGGAVFMSMANKASVVPADWKTFTGKGFTMQYPETLGTSYITPTEWPPRAQLFAGNPTCNEGGSEMSEAGETKNVEINNHPYCMAKKTEGAAGSTYSQYVYAFSKGENKAGVLTFALRFVQCGNFDEPKKTECEKERAKFDIENIIDLMAQSIVTSTAASTTVQ